MLSYGCNRLLQLFIICDKIQYKTIGSRNKYTLALALVGTC